MAAATYGALVIATATGGLKDTVKGGGGGGRVDLRRWSVGGWTCENEGSFRVSRN